MAPAPASVLAISGGSSSIKFAVYQAGALKQSTLSGTLDWLESREEFSDVSAVGHRVVHGMARSSGQWGQPGRGPGRHEHRYHHRGSRRRPGW